MANRCTTNHPHNADEIRTEVSSGRSANAVLNRSLVFQSRLSKVSIRRQMNRFIHFVVVDDSSPERAKKGKHEEERKSEEHRESERKPLFNSHLNNKWGESGLLRRN